MSGCARRPARRTPGCRWWGSSSGASPSRRPTWRGRSGAASASADQAAAADAAFDRPWFAAYNAVTVVACVVGAAFASWWLRRRRGPGTLQRRALLVVAGVLALRAALGWVGLTADALRGTVDTTWLLVGVELWFMLGALLLLLVARRSAAP